MVSPDDEVNASIMDTDTCLCGKRIILINGVPVDHHPKKNFQPRFFEMSRKQRKGFWCDVFIRLKNVEQKVIKTSNDAYKRLDVFQANVEFDLDCKRLAIT